MSLVIRMAEPTDVAAISDLVKQDIAAADVRHYVVACNGENETELIGVAGTKIVGNVGVAQIGTVPGCILLHELVRLYLVAAEHHSGIDVLYITAEQAGGKEFLHEICEFSFAKRTELLQKVAETVGQSVVMVKVFEREKSSRAA